MTCGPVVHVSHFYSLLAQALALLLSLGLLSYVLHKKGLSWLRSLIQQYHDHTQALEHEKELLAEQQKELDQAIKDQTALFEHLNMVMAQWRLVQEKKRETDQERYTAFMKVALANNKIRQTTVQDMYLARQVVPQACEQARIFFKEKFSSPEQADIFLSALCDRIERHS